MAQSDDTSFTRFVNDVDEIKLPGDLDPIPIVNPVNPIDTGLLIRAIATSFVVAWVLGFLEFIRSIFEFLWGQFVALTAWVTTLLSALIGVPQRLLPGAFQQATESLAVLGPFQPIGQAAVIFGTILVTLFVLNKAQQVMFG